jgi:predicted transcriptional regulator
MRAITITLEKTLEEALRQAAAAHGESVSSIVRLALADYLAQINGNESSSSTTESKEAPH